MANNWYALYKQNLLAGTTSPAYDLDNNDTTNNPYCALSDSAIYAYNATSDNMYSTAAAGLVGTAVPIMAPTVALGVFDGNDITFTAVPAGPDANALVIYRHNSGASSTWPLVLHLDAAVSGLPVVPNGGNITVGWNASGIARLGSAPT